MVKTHQYEIQYQHRHPSEQHLFSKGGKGEQQEGVLEHLGRGNILTKFRATKHQYATHK
jgi:hypothetical protein